ncbi:YcaO-like family protein [Vibrio sp. S4M6]|uniref:YcaO-like family protein n=1 Tax=Vibrio sinus TaxID=2946865 RepID=UPI00202A25AF|nr:YcaO-like family protein [Vibrio sinus]MCL9780775.1 YcaO-like family protein [Vibrio sinus]
MSNLNALIHSLHPLFDKDGGLLGELSLLPNTGVSEDSLFGYSASVGSLYHLCQHLPQTLGYGSATGYGTALDSDVAKIRAIGEAIERYCAMIPPLLGRKRASYNELQGHALDPRSLPQPSSTELSYAPDNIKLKPFSDTRTDEWVDGVNLIKQSSAWLPIDVVCMGLNQPLSEHYTYPVSTGFAAGTSYTQATLAALCEIVERDSFALWWLHKLPHPKLDPNAIDDPEIHRLLEQLSAQGITTTLFDITTTLGLPVVALIQQSDTYPHYVCMAACRTTSRDAALRVIEEASSVRIGLLNNPPSCSKDEIVAGKLASPLDFGALYAGQRHTSAFDFAMNVQPPYAPWRQDAGFEPEHPYKFLNNILQRFAKLELELYAADVTLPEVKDTGMVVVKVIAPQLMPLTFCHALRFLGTPRLFTEPQNMGFSLNKTHEVNHDPIPFA